MSAGYRPSLWGQEYHSLTVDEALGAGAAGPGKSMVLLMDPITTVMVEHKRCRDRHHPYHIPMGESVGWAIHLRRTRPMLDLTISRSKRLFPKIDPGAHYDEKNCRWTFSCGYKYDFGHCKDPNDWDRYMSNEYDWVGFDELIQFEEEQFHQISGRARSGDPVLRSWVKIRSMSNPMMRKEGSEAITMKDPQWVRRRYVDGAPQGRVIKKREIKLASGKTRWVTRIYLPATLYDNPDKNFVEDYETRLRSKPDHIRKILLEGDWYYTLGSFFGDVWDPRLHIIPEFAIPYDWPISRSMDWGLKRPGCVLWWAINPEGTLFCIREYTFQGKYADEVAHRIKEIEKEMGVWKNGRSTITGPADTQLWEERGDVSKTKAATMAEMGVSWVPANKKSRIANAERLTKRLMDHDYGTRDPGIIFFEGCTRCIQTIPAIQTDPHDPEEPLGGGEDHWYDAVVYQCAFASHGRVGRPASEDDDDERPEPTRSDGYGYGINY